MTWLSSVFVALLTGALGLVCAAVIGQLCVGWYRISSFEGGAGYAVVAIALLGGIVSAVIGLVAARIVAAGVEPGLLKGLGFGCGAVVALSLVALGLCRLGADRAPELGGKALELAIEVRCPKGFAVPQPDDYGAHAGVYLPGGRRLPSGALRIAEKRMTDGRLVIPATAPLTTSSSDKYLSVRFNKEHDLLFPLPLRSHPGESDREWSAWVESGGDAGQPPPPPEARFGVRWRVQTIEPPPPPRDPKEEVAREFAALAPDAPLERWLPFLFREPNAERTAAVAKVINERQAELAALIRSDKTVVREQALHGATYPAQLAPEVVEAVLAEGRIIAAEVRRCNALPPDSQDFIDSLVGLRSRFNEWKQSWWTVHQRLGVDGRPPVREIHELARAGARGSAMDEIEVNARAILEQLDKNAAGKKP